MRGWEKDIEQEPAGESQRLQHERPVGGFAVSESDFMDELLEEVPERFTIDDDRKANWALEIVFKARQDGARAIAHHKEQMRLEEAHIASTEAFFMPLLEMYFDSLPTRKATTQESYVLPSGKLTRKYAKQDIEAGDQLADWLQVEQLTEFFELTPKPLWASLKKAVSIVGDKVVLNETGQIVPFINIVEKPKTFKATEKKEV